MNRSLAYIIIGVVVLLITALIVLIRAYSPKYSWQDDFRKTSEQPYGLSIFYNLVNTSTPSEHFHELIDRDFERVFSGKENATYVFIGSAYFIDSVNVDNILDFVRQGNNAFISGTHQIDYFLKLWLKNEKDRKAYTSVSRDSIDTKLFLENSVSDSTYNFYHQFLKKTTPYTWFYFNENWLGSMVPSSYEVLSTINGKPNFIVFKAGWGKLYLHSNPIFFSNYHLKREQTYDYLTAVWNEVAGEEIIWDSYSSYPYNKTAFSGFGESPLSFILGNTSFRWAWYTLLITILLFIIVMAKRKQNTIPLIRQKENNTLEYAQAIGSLYFQSGNHKTITDEMLTQLFAFIKARYNIKIGKERERVIPQLARVSGISGNNIEAIFKTEVKLKYNEDAESEELLRLFNLVDDFYKKCN